MLLCLSFGFDSILIVMKTVGASVLDTLVFCLAPSEDISLEEKVNEENKISNIHEGSQHEDSGVEVALDLKQLNQRSKY